MLPASEASRRLEQRRRAHARGVDQVDTVRPSPTRYADAKQTQAPATGDGISLLELRTKQARGQHK